MKTVIHCVLFLFLVGSVNAETFSVGGIDLEIPSPKGFSIVTKEMDAVYRFNQQMVDPVNDVLAYYISESDAPAALSGKIPSLARYYLLKVNKELKKVVVSSTDFAQLKSITKQQNKEIFKSLENQAPDLMKKASQGISKEFDVDFAMTLSKMIPLDSHYETDDAFAYSMYLNFGTTVEGSKKDLIISATATFINVAGKILFLYCYGTKEEIEWTRNASKTWAEVILTSNSKPPSNSSGGHGIDWNKVLKKAIVGALIGGLIALIIVVLLWIKKKR